MLDEDELILALRTYDAIRRLDTLVSAMTKKGGLAGTDFDDIFCITELLYKQCSFYQPESDECYAAMMDIISDEKLTLQEKLNKIT